MSHGHLILGLHAHLPYIRHPEDGDFLEENWLYEAMAETYLPLLRVLNRLETDGVPFRIALSLSPTLVAMLQDELLQERFVGYTERMLELGEREVDRTSGQGSMQTMARSYRDLHETNLREFLDDYERDITRGFDFHYKRGRLEIMATAATHAYLPLYVQHPAALRAQIRVGIEEHTRVFGKAPAGFWLPECGYSPGMEEVLSDHGIRYTIVATHGLIFADNTPESGVYKPTLCKNGLAVFGRDHASSNAVWSEDEGYPSDPAYRDFYRDIGHDLPLDYLGPYLPSGSLRMNTGFKYYRVTGKTNQKLPYDPALAAQRVQEHADNFLYLLSKRIKRLSSLMETPPTLTAPFDAELFGHWWYEGPKWLEAVVRGIAQNDSVSLVSPSEYLKAYPTHQTATPSFSSWGTKGYSEVWLDGSNDWVYRHVHKAAERMYELVERYPDESGLRQRALAQAAREALLSQASDWPFIMRAGTAVPYAVRRVKDHVANVAHVYDALSRGNIGTEWLTRVERQHKLFPNLDYRIFGWNGDKDPFSARLPQVKGPKTDS